MNQQLRKLKKERNRLKRKARRSFMHKHPRSDTYAFQLFNHKIQLRLKASREMVLKSLFGTTKTKIFTERNKHGLRDNMHN